MNWLTRQLGKAPDATLVEAWAAWARTPGPCHPLPAIRKTPDALFDDPQKELKSFTVRLSAVAGTKRGQGRGTFVGSVLALIDTFYESVVQNIKPWTPPAPTVKGRPIDGDVQDEDGIAGGLPLKSVHRDVSPPQWDAAQAQPDGDLDYTAEPDAPTLLAPDTEQEEAREGNDGPPPALRATEVAGVEPVDPL